MLLQDPKDIIWTSMFNKIRRYCSYFFRQFRPTLHELASIWFKLQGALIAWQQLNRTLRILHMCTLYRLGYSKAVASSLSCCKRAFQKVYLYQSHKIWGLLDKYTTTTIIVLILLYESPIKMRSSNYLCISLRPFISRPAWYKSKKCRIEQNPAMLTDNI